jgi:hypothetical protein
MECHNIFLVAKSHVGVQAVAKRKKEKKETGHFLLMGKDQILKSCRILIKMTVVAHCLLMGLFAPIFAYSQIVLVLLSRPLF